MKLIKIEKNRKIIKREIIIEELALLKKPKIPLKFLKIK